MEISLFNLLFEDRTSMRKVASPIGVETKPPCKGSSGRSPSGCANAQTNKLHGTTGMPSILSHRSLYSLFQMSHASKNLLSAGFRLSLVKL